MTSPLELVDPSYADVRARRRRTTNEALKAAANVLVSQHGVATRGQLIECGMSPRQIERRLWEGRLDGVARGVYVLRVTPDTWERRAVAAVLVTAIRAYPGALSHESAAASWGIDGFERGGQIIMTAPSGDRHVNPLAIMSRAADLLPEDVVVGPLGVATTSIVRTVLDLAVRTSNPAALERLMDRVLADDRIALADLRARAQDMTGRAGIIAARKELNRRKRMARRARPKRSKRCSSSESIAA